jgi:hypothetical protein
VGDISIRSRFFDAAAISASASGITPILALFSSITRSSFAVISRLMRAFVIMRLW